MNVIAAFLGRVFIALLFIVSGVFKLTNPAGNEAMITGTGLPPGLAIPTGIFEIVAGLFLAVGLMTRLASLLLAGFVALTILFYHHDLTTRLGAIQFFQHLALIGGLLAVFAHSQMRWSYDSMRTRRKGELATREAEARAHEAELRAARAEGRAAVVPTGTTVTDVDHDGRPEVHKKRRWF
jgi:putative oxidoreductase